MTLNITLQQARRTFKEYAVITIGLLIYSFSYICIILPANFVGGGASGMALLIYHATGGAMPVGIGVFGINAILLAIAVRIIGFKFGAKTIYAIIIMSVFMAILQKFVPPDLLGALSEDRLLSALLGGAVCGGGIAMCFSQGGSTGGTDIVAMIINHYRSISYGRVIMMCDSVVIAASFFLNNDITAVIYGYVLVAVVGYTIDTIMAGNKQSAQLFIISDKSEEVTEMIVTKLNRGVTLLEATGGYTKQKRKVIMIVCRRNETAILLRMIREVDPDAFITMGSVMGVYGQGFEPLTK